MSETALNSAPPLSIEWIGSNVVYADALAQQKSVVRKKIEFSNDTPDRLFLLEHAPVYTIGKTPNRSSLIANRDSNNICIVNSDVITTNRGGQATYHGPGQLVGYPIIDLTKYGRDLHKYLRFLEEVLIKSLKEVGIESDRRETFTGVWVQNRKIASLGVGVRKWISMHGFAINVEERSIPPFSQITPCGIDGVTMTSVSTELKKPISVMEFKTVVERVFQQQIQAFFVTSHR